MSNIHMNPETELRNAIIDANQHLSSIIALRITIIPIHDSDITFTYSITNEDDLISILRTLSKYTYNSGYGTQNLFGLVLFSDNTWLSRYEYDGSEYWIYNKPPTIEEVLNIDNLD